MKIGILTFHFGTNYGGILQCYALYSYLKSQGHEVEVIDYRSNKKISLQKRIYNKIKGITSVKQLASLFKYLLYRKSHTNCKYLNPLSEIFNDFRSKYLILSPKVDDITINSFSSRYDCVIVGSDQVWTDLYSENNTYFLDWISNDSPTRRISYAACSAHNKVLGNRIKQLNNLLSKFNLITVRDTTTSNLVEHIIGKMPQLVADPTLLYDFKDFVTPQISKPYILAYILDGEIYGGHGNAISMIKERYGELSVRFIYIPGQNDSAIKCADEVLTDVTPQQWVNLFAHASFVYTDSFHAIMFALKFNKPLLAYYTNPIRASRLLDLKKRIPNLMIVDKCPKILDDTRSECDLEPFITASKNILDIAIKIE